MAYNFRAGLECAWAHLAAVGWQRAGYGGGLMVPNAHKSATAAPQPSAGADLAGIFAGPPEISSGTKARDTFGSFDVPLIDESQPDRANSVFLEIVWHHTR